MLSFLNSDTPSSSESASSTQTSYANNEPYIIGFFSIINTITSLFIVTSFVLFKSRLTIQDQIICQKYVIQFIFFFSYIVIAIYNQSKSDKTTIPYMKQEFLCIYILAIYLFTLFQNYEGYISLRDPTHTLRVLIKNSKSYLFYDVIIIIIAGIIVITQLQGETITINTNNLTESYNLIHNKNYFFSLICLICALMLIILYVLNKKNYPNYRFRSTITFEKINKINLSLNIFYMLYILFIMCGFLLYLGKQPSLFYSHFSVICIYILGTIDIILNMALIYYSSFYYYYLGHSNLGSCFCCFGCNKNYFNTLKFNDASTYQTNNLDYFMMKLYHKIGFIIDDYVVETFDYMLNLSTISISLIYERLSDGSYIYIKNKNKNDFNTPLINNIPRKNPNFNFDRTNDIEVRVESFYTEKIKETMETYNINPNQIITSLLSHNFSSLLSKNSKEEYFKSLRSLCMKTYDKKLIIEIYSDIDFNNKKMNSFINQYFTHLNHNKANTFLPILVGVFKVKINNFRNITLFICINPLIEDIPQTRYNFWQLMRFEYPCNLHKIASSKDKDSFIVTTELIFDKKEKFKIDNFILFKQIIEKDFAFLKRVKSDNFAFVILYYEYGAGSKKGALLPNNIIDQDDDDDDAQQIKEIDKLQEMKIIKNDDVLVGSDDFKFIPDDDVNNNVHEISDSLDEKFLGIESVHHKNLRIDEEIQSKFKENANNNNNNEDLQSLSVFINELSKTAITKNGFETNYNNYKGIMYFSFETLFYMGGCLKRNSFFDTYLKEMMNVFGSK